MVLVGEFTTKNTKIELPEKNGSDHLFFLTRLVELDTLLLEICIEEDNAWRIWFNSLTQSRNKDFICTF